MNGFILGGFEPKLLLITPKNAGKWRRVRVRREVLGEVSLEKFLQSESEGETEVEESKSLKKA